MEESIDSSNEISDWNNFFYQSYTWSISISCRFVSLKIFEILCNILQFNRYFSCITRFAYVGIMAYIAWDSYANPNHKDRVQAFTSKVCLCHIPFFFIFVVCDKHFIIYRYTPSFRDVKPCTCFLSHWEPLSIYLASTALMELC